MADLNPYAAPHVLDPVLPERGLAGSAWRDGKFLVVHRLGATLPHVCLHTGEPAEMRLPIHVRWSYPVDFTTRDTVVEIGMTLAASRRNTRLGHAGCASHLVAVVAIFCLALGGGQFSRPVFLLLLVPLLVSAVCGMVISHYTELLRFAKARGEFIWLRGACPRFLEKLPDWPGGN
jgi:hypothetical protein